MKRNALERFGLIQSELAERKEMENYCIAYVVHCWHFRNFESKRKKKKLPSDFLRFLTFQRNAIGQSQTQQQFLGTPKMRRQFPRPAAAHHSTQSQQLPSNGNPRQKMFTGNVAGEPGPILFNGSSQFDTQSLQARR